jgi:hypothetical protein
VAGVDLFNRRAFRFINVITRVFHQQPGNSDQ